MRVKPRLYFKGFTAILTACSLLSRSGARAKCLLFLMSCAFCIVVSIWVYTARYSPLHIRNTIYSHLLKLRVCPIYTLINILRAIKDKRPNIESDLTHKADIKYKKKTNAPTSNGIASFSDGGCHGIHCARGAERTSSESTLAEFRTFTLTIFISTRYFIVLTGT